MPNTMAVNALREASRGPDSKEVQFRIHPRCGFQLFAYIAVEKVMTGAAQICALLHTLQGPAFVSR